MKTLPWITAAALLATACGAQEYNVTTGALARAQDAASNTEPDVVVGERASTDDYPADTAKNPKAEKPRPTDSGNDAANQDDNAAGNPQPHASLPKTDLLKLAQDFELPEPNTGNQNTETLWATYYFLPQVEASNQGFDLLDAKGTPLGPKLSKRDWCDAAMEGSIRIRFGGEERTYNYASNSGKQQVDCSEFFPHKLGGTRFKLAKGSFGDGVKNYMLVTFRTIAVDSETIPYGSVVYIPAARGVKITLPNGQKVAHDGYFFAGDTGGAIIGNHIDVFIGVAPKNPFPWVTSDESETFDARILDNADIATTLLTLHTKK